MIPTFIDIKEQDQCEELREYFAGLGASISRENSPDGFETDLAQIISVIDVCFNEEKEADIESVLNSIVSLLIQVPHVNPLCHQLISAFYEKLVSVNKHGNMCLRVLQNLSEGIGENDVLRYDVYVALVKIAGEINQISLVYDDINQVKTCFNPTTVGIEKFQNLLRLLYDVLLKDGQSEKASKVMIELLGTYTEENASQARSDAHRCIVACIADSNTFLMDHLLALKPVKFLEGELIHDLLTIFVAQKLTAYINFYNSHKDFVNNLGLSHEKNVQKMKLLTFMQIAETKKEIPFDVIQDEIHLEPNQVEDFVIDVLRTRLVKAKVDQVNKKVTVTSTIHRTFGKQQWLQLRDTLSLWKQNLSVVQATIATALRAHYEQVNQMGPIST